MGGELLEQWFSSPSAEQNHLWLLKTARFWDLKDSVSVVKPRILPLEGPFPRRVGAGGA